jgi:hypothetical protein
MTTAWSVAFVYSVQACCIVPECKFQSFTTCAVFFDCAATGRAATLSQDYGKYGTLRAALTGSSSLVLAAVPI